MKINYSNINNTLDFKKQIQTSVAPKTKKEDKDYRYKLYPLINVGISQNLILQINTYVVYKISYELYLCL